MLLREVMAACVTKRHVGHIQSRTWLKGRSSQGIEILSLSFPTLLVTCERPCWVATASYSGGQSHTVDIPCKQTCLQQLIALPDAWTACLLTTPREQLVWLLWFFLIGHLTACWAEPVGRVHSVWVPLLLAIGETEKCQGGLNTQVRPEWISFGQAIFPCFKSLF